MTNSLVSRRAIISVVSPHANSGKSLFVTHLLRHVGGLGCLKITPTRDRTGAVRDGAEPVEEEFSLEDRGQLDRPGKDTAIWLAAGAKRVERLKHWGNGLRAGLDVALARFPSAMPVVVESSSAVQLLTPVAVVLVIHPPIREMKPATEAILSRVSDVMINASWNDDAVSAAEELYRRFPLLHSSTLWSSDLISEPPPDAMLTRLQALLATRHLDSYGSSSLPRGVRG